MQVQITRQNFVDICLINGQQHFKMQHAMHMSINMHYSLIAEFLMNSQPTEDFIAVSTSTVM